MIIEWPIMGVSDLAGSIDYYSQRLSFELCERDDGAATPNEAKLKLNDFYLFLRLGDSGPITRESVRKVGTVENIFKKKGLLAFIKSRIAKRKADPEEKQQELLRDLQQESPSLFIPVPDLDKYFNDITMKGAQVISDKEWIAYDFETFHVQDNEQKVLVFFRDYHGPCDPNHWEWAWEVEN